MDILNEIKTFLKKYKLLNKDMHFLVGFSGGADSMLLLYYLNELRKDYKFKLSVLHINHGWRGKESDNEQQICEDFCKKYSIDFYCEKLNSNIKKNENSARIARYDLFNKYAENLKATAILTAHNSSDVVETFIYRLAKGMGTVGAKSIPEVRNAIHCKIYRPLINVSSKVIRKECENLDLKYNVDSSNNNNKYKRNLIRNKIIPMLEEINPNMESSVLNFIENIKSHENLIENYYDKNVENVISNNKIITSEFMNFSYDIKRIIIYKYLKNNNIEPEKDLIIRLIKQIEENINKPNGKKYSIKNTENSKDKIYFFCSKKECYIVNNKEIKIEIVKFKKEFFPPIKVYEYKGEKIPKSKDCKAVVNKQALKFPMEIRTRRTGDLIQPFSHNSIIKLKDYFIDKKIPEHKRDEIPLLCSGKEVLWVIGVGISEKLRANLDCKKNCIYIKYQV